MSNFKKVLAMVLAVMMVMALMTTAFAAEAKALDYSDSSFQDEAQLLNELGIIVGGDGGNWDAERLVTRGEFTKMICVAMNGGVDNPALYTGENTTGLTDIDTHWAKGYIIYCFKLGIIAGVGDGTFSPNTSVTGVQAAKILLTALGYDAVKEGYVNVADWELNINVKAGEQHLYEGLGAQYDPRQPLTRDFAAKMIANMFDCRMVYYDQNINVQLQALTFGQSRLRLTTLEGVLVANEYTSVAGISNSAPKGKSYVNVTSYSLFAPTEIPGASSIDDLGKSVNVYARFKVAYATEDYFNNRGGVVMTPTVLENAIEKIFGAITPTSRNRVYTTGKGFDDVGGFNSYLNDTKIRFASTNYQVNYGPSAVSTSNLIADYGNVLKGDGIKLVDNDGNGAIDYAFIVEDRFAEVTDVDTARSRITITVLEGGSDTYEFGDIIGLDAAELKVGDRVLTYRINPNGKYVMTLVEPFVGQLTGSTTAGPNHVAIISGKNYQFANNPLGGNANITAKGKVATWDKLDAAQNYGTDVTYWLDSFGYILAYKGAEASNDYCVITDAVVIPYVDLASDAARAEVSILKADGTRGTYKVTTVEAYKNDGTTLRIARWDGTKGLGANNDNDNRAIYNALYPGDQAQIGKVFAYIIDETNRTIELRKVATPVNPTGSAAAYRNSSTINFGGSSYVVNDESVFFLRDNDEKWYAYTGRANIPEISAGVKTTSISASGSETNRWYVGNGAPAAPGAAGASDGKVYVINSAKANQAATVGALAGAIDIDELRAQGGRYVVVASTPVYTSTGGNISVTFKGIFDGEVIDMKSRANAEGIGTIASDNRLVKRGMVLEYEGTSDNFQKCWVRNTAPATSAPSAGDEWYVGNIMGKSGGTYPDYIFGWNKVLDSWTHALGTSADTKFTRVTGNAETPTISTSSAPSLINDSDRKADSFTAVAVMDGNNIRDLVVFPADGQIKLSDVGATGGSWNVSLIDYGSGGGAPIPTGSSAVLGVLKNGVAYTVDTAVPTVAGHVWYNAFAENLQYYEGTVVKTVENLTADDKAFFGALGSGDTFTLTSNKVSQITTNAGRVLPLTNGIVGGALEVAGSADTGIELTGTILTDVTISRDMNSDTIDVSGLAANSIKFTGAITSSGIIDAGSNDIILSDTTNASTYAGGILANDVEIRAAGAIDLSSGSTIGGTITITCEDDTVTSIATDDQDVTFALKSGSGSSISIGAVDVGTGTVTVLAPDDDEDLTFSTDFTGNLFINGGIVTDVAAGSGTLKNVEIFGAAEVADISEAITGYLKIYGTAQVTNISDDIVGDVTIYGDAVVTDINGGDVSGNVVIEGGATVTDFTADIIDNKDLTIRGNAQVDDFSGAIARNLYISGTPNIDAFSSSGTGRDAFIDGGTVDVLPDITRDLIVTGGVITTTGTVGGDLEVSGDADITLGGAVSGVTTIAAGYTGDAVLADNYAGNNGTELVFGGALGTSGTVSITNKGTTTCLFTVTGQNGVAGVVTQGTNSTVPTATAVLNVVTLDNNTNMTSGGTSWSATFLNGTLKADVTNDSGTPANIATVEFSRP